MTMVTAPGNVVQKFCFVGRGGPAGEGGITDVTTANYPPGASSSGDRRLG
jgi:hypothetical protein